MDDSDTALITQPDKCHQRCWRFLVAGSLGESPASLRPSRRWQGSADGVVSVSGEPVEPRLSTIGVVSCAGLRLDKLRTNGSSGPFASTGSGRTAVRWPSVSTLACPERRPWQAAEGLDTNGGGKRFPFLCPCVGRGPSREIAARLMVDWHPDWRLARKSHLPC